MLTKLKKKLNSKYLLNIPYSDNERILFNRTNGAIFTLSNDEFNSLLNESQNISNYMYNELTESDVLSFNNIVFYGSDSCVVITIELSTMCNLKCTYCYQIGEKGREEISEATLNHIYRYIENVLKNNHKAKEIVIGYIGGEPLLHMNKLLSSMSVIKAMCISLGKLCFFHIDTNGTIDFSEQYNSLNGIQLSVSLTPKNDHNKNRPSLLFDSYDVILSNLIKLNNPKNRLSIRYNTNDKNINDFDKFVGLIKTELPSVYNIDAMYTYSYSGNDNFENALTNAQFSFWNATKAIDILIENKFPITTTIASMLQLCMAYQPFSCKVHADGFVTLCDSMKHSVKLNIQELSSDISLLEKVYTKEKNYNPLNDTKCRKCAKIIQCQGQLFCKERPCHYEARINEAEFLKTYIRHCVLGNENFFVGMLDDE